MNETKEKTEGMKRKDVITLIIGVTLVLGLAVMPLYLPADVISKILEIILKIIMLCLMIFIARSFSMDAFKKMENCKELSQLVTFFAFLLAAIIVIISK